MSSFQRLSDKDGVITCTTYLHIHLWRFEQSRWSEDQFRGPTHSRRGYHLHRCPQEARKLSSV